MDLIFGWPNQTIDHMLRDLKALVDAGITHLTHYELNVAGRTDFARNRRGALPSTDQNLEMYRIGRDYLVSEGFTQVTPYDFERRGPLPSSYLYEELFRKPFREDEGQLVGYDAWGWGFAGISFFFGTPQDPGWAYMNQIRVDDYFRDLDAGRFPVMRGFRYSSVDLRLHLLFQELQSLSLDRRRYLTLMGRDAVEDHRAVWDALADLEWATVDDDLIAIEGDGAFYLPLIQNALAHDRLDAMRKERRVTTAGVRADDALAAQAQDAAAPLAAARAS